MASFLVTLDALLAQLLAFQPFVHGVLDSKVGGCQNRVNVRAAPTDDGTGEAVTLSLT